MLVLCFVPAVPNRGQVLRGFGGQSFADWLWAHGVRVLIIVLVALLLIWLLRMVSGRIAALAGSAGRAGGGRDQQIHTLMGVLNGTCTVIIVAIAGVQILQQVGVAVGPLLEGAGLAGLAIAFGAQTLIKDLINGFFILLDDQFRVGDSIKAAGVQGKVERLTLRRTVLRDGDGTLHFVPNSAMQVVSNLTRDWNVAVLRVAVPYRADSARVMAALRAAGEQARAQDEMRGRVSGEISVPGIERVNGDAAEYLLQLRTVPGAQADVLRALRAAVKHQLAAAGIEAWYPQINLPGITSATAAGA